MTHNTAPIFILVWTDIPPEDEAAFNEWYDREHIRDRLAVPGIVEVCRYAALEGGPKYVALYKARDRGVLSSAPYRALRAKPDPRSTHFIPRFRNTIRTIIYSAIEHGGQAGTHAAFAAVAGTAATMPPRSTLEAALALSQPAALRSRLLLTDFDVLADQARNLANSARSRLRTGDRVPATVLMIETASAGEAEACRQTLLEYLARHMDVIGSGTFQQITRLDGPA